jgi:hypothetical protein
MKYASIYIYKFQIHINIILRFWTEATHPQNKMASALLNIYIILSVQYTTRHELDDLVGTSE